ncbi:MAG: hypothetical protein KIH08_11565, partial [Candidatus Freyarchaeota archaeon]|nr:hypothetical protein [Candidatus Jordarchaeia archaeon]
KIFRTLLALSQVDMFLLEQCVETVKYLDQMIGRVDDMIRGLVGEEGLRLPALSRVWMRRRRL